MSETRTGLIEPATLPALGPSRSQSLRAGWWMLAIVLMMGLLLAPAIFNGFPIVFADTGGYLLRPIEGQLELGRSALYGAFLLAGIAFDFWPVVIVQAAVTCWIIVLTLRAFDLGERPGAALAVVLILTLASSLPWYVGQLMPDIFVPLCALALYLLAFRGRRLHGLEMLGLGAVVAFAMASHMAILGMALIILAGFAAVRCLPAGLALPRPGMLASSGAVAAGIALAVFSNLMIAGVFGFTPGGSSFVFARLIQDGIIARYLHDRCPDAEIHLCAYRRELPDNTDDWMWTGDSPLVKLGGWEQFEPEAKYIIHDTLRRYPYAHLAAAVRNTAKQLVTVRTGDGTTPDNNWHVEWVFREHAPHALQLYYGSAQSRNALHFSAINALHVPVALLATALLPLLFVMLLRRRPAAAWFVLTMMMALLANAAICGVFAGPGGRYQSRLVPVAILAVIVGGWVLRRPDDRLPQPAAAGEQ